MVTKCLNSAFQSQLSIYSKFYTDVSLLRVSHNSNLNDFIRRNYLFDVKYAPIVINTYE